MSLYELEGMMRMLAKGNKSARGRTMTDDEFDAALQKVREMNLPDVMV